MTRPRPTTARMIVGLILVAAALTGCQSGSDPEADAPAAVGLDPATLDRDERREATRELNRVFRALLEESRDGDPARAREAADPSVVAALRSTRDESAFNPRCGPTARQSTERDDVYTGDQPWRCGMRTGGPAVRAYEVGFDRIDGVWTAFDAELVAEYEV